MKTAVLWLTGHSQTGKTTLAKILEQQLRDNGQRVIRLDSDTLPISIIKPSAPTWEERQRLKLENIVSLASPNSGYITSGLPIPIHPSLPSG